MKLSTGCRTVNAYMLIFLTLILFGFNELITKSIFPAPCFCKEHLENLAPKNISFIEMIIDEEKML